MKKVLFFDIDGTLVNFQAQMPDSAKEALKAAQRGGHKIVLCTGRCRCQIQQQLLDFGFNGIVASAGAYVEAEGNVLYCHRMAPSQLLPLFDYFDSRGTIYVLQAAQEMVATGVHKQRLQRILSEEMKMPDWRVNRVINLIRTVDTVRDHAVAEKLLYYDSPDDYRTVSGRISDYFTLTPFSFDLPVESRGEITCSGENKASGMQHLLSYYGVGAQAAVAFGDGPNDFDMIRFAGTSVVMGNGKEALKKEADLVTASLEEDGIYKAMQQLGLI